MTNDEYQRNLEAFSKQVQDMHCKYEEALVKLQESIEVLRVYVKYQTFDLEATRREKKLLEKAIKRMLERENDSN